jgi:hypothetical protein
LLHRCHEIKNVSAYAAFGETLKRILPKVDGKILISLRAFVNWARSAQLFATFGQAIDAVMVENHLHVDCAFYLLEIDPLCGHKKSSSSS